MNGVVQWSKYLPLAYSDYETGTAGVIVGLIFVVLGLLLATIMIVSLWKIFAKAGEPGWAALVPIYNMFVMYKISWGKGIYFLLLLIPGVNAVIGLITIYKLGQNFGKGTGYTLGMMFLPLIFMPMLAFSDAEFLGIADGRGNFMPIGGMPYPQYGQQMYQGYQGGAQQGYGGGYQGQPQPYQGGYQGQQQPYQGQQSYQGYQGQQQPPYQGNQQ